LGLLPPRLPSRICFKVLLWNILTMCQVNFNL
jgi:hypothetical protein